MASRKWLWVACPSALHEAQQGSQQDSGALQSARNFLDLIIQRMSDMTILLQTLPLSQDVVTDASKSPITTFLPPARYSILRIGTLRRTRAVESLGHAGRAHGTSP